MSVLSKIFLNWHTFRMNYHEILLDGCICSNMKKKLHNKIYYHRHKINEIKTMNAPF